jgi:DNA invertase Pin-like site-specific DNA recombinase
MTPRTLQTPKAPKDTTRTSLAHVAALYLRVSSKSQAEDDKTSLQTQEAECWAYADAQGLVVAESHVYREACTAEDYYERPVLLEMRAAAARGAFSVVVVHAVDRLSRDPNHLAVVLTELERAGIEVRFAIDSLEDTPEGRLIAYVKGYAAQMENRMRRERTLRAKRARVAKGHLLPSNRPLYGYQWGPECDEHGQLLKQRMLPDPVTAPIVERIFHEAASGKTLRSIAAALTSEGIPTPATYAGQKNGAAAWDPGVVMHMLAHSTYWGEPHAFTTKAVHLTPQERALGGYKHRVTRIIRPLDEQVALPASVAPPLVTRDIALEVQRRAQMNRALASRNNHHPDDTLLRGGFARCGYCGGALTVTNTSRRDSAGMSSSTYQCKRPLRVKGSCATFAIKTRVLDTAIWRPISALLLDPRLIAYELERCRTETTQTPAQAAVDAIDARLADVARRIQNKRKLAELIDDDDERADLADELTALRAQQRALEGERAVATFHATRTEAQAQALQRIQDWAATIAQAGNVSTLTTSQRREVLAALGAVVHVWRVEDRQPRVTLDLHLPVSGALPVLQEQDGSTSICVTTVTGKIQKYLMRQQAIQELGLEQAAAAQTA